MRLTSFFPTTLRQMSLRECAKFDKDNGAKQRLTGWGAVCKARTGPHSKSQRRKAANR